LSPSTVSFEWAAPNGTTISYTIITDPAQIDSLSGPWIQFTRTFGDFQPYSYLLLVPLLLTPIVETYRLIRRRRQRQRTKDRLPPPLHQPSPSLLIREPERPILRPLRNLPNPVSLPVNKPGNPSVSTGTTGNPYITSRDGSPQALPRRREALFYT